MILFQRPEPIDWFLLLNDFKRMGHKIPEVARALGVSERTVYSWCEVSCPRYEDGRALVMLYQDIFFKNPPSKPVVEATPYPANLYS